MIGFKNRLKNLREDYKFITVSDITPEFLDSMGAEAVAIDLDDTMVKNRSYSMPEKSVEWVKKLRNRNIPVIIVTNTFILRARYLSSKIGNIPVVPLAFKPYPFALRKASRRLGIKPGKIAMIGDRYDKDVISAKLAGAISVKVERAPV